MAKKRNLWTEEELIMALNLYWEIPYNKISGSSNLAIQNFAKIINRTPASVAFKLMNFTSLDPERQKLKKKGNLQRENWIKSFGTSILVNGKNYLMKVHC